MNLKLILNWLVYSSDNSEKISATVKGSVIFAFLTAIAAFFHINGISDLADHGVSFVVTLGKLISEAYVIFGFVRKLWTTHQGTNAVLGNQQLR